MASIAEVLDLSSLDMSAQSGRSLSPSTPSTPTTDTPDSASLLLLPPEVLEKICKHLDLNDLVKVTQVCFAFLELAAGLLYRQISHTFFPDAMDAYFSEEHFTAIMRTLSEGTYSYARHVREVTINTTYSNELAGWPQTEYQDMPNRCVKVVNKYLSSTLTKMTGLGSFKWDIKVELVRPLFIALGHLNNLQSLHVRLPADGIFRGSRIYQSLHDAYKMNDQLEFHHEWQKVSKTKYRGESTFSLIKGLRNLAVLDIPSLTYIPEVARCISSSCSTLRTLQLSFSDKLAIKHLGRDVSFDDNRDSFDFSDLFELNTFDYPASVQKSSLDAGLQNELLTQKKALAFLFGMGFSLMGPAPKKHTERRDPVSKNPPALVQATVGSSVALLTSGQGHEPQTSKKSDHTKAGVSLVNSSLASSEPASFGVAAANNLVRESISSVDDLKQLCETARRLSLEPKGQAKVPSTVAEESEEDDESKKPQDPEQPKQADKLKEAKKAKKSKDRYLRDTYGLPLEGLYIYQIPVAASVLTRGIELSCLKHLSLLNVGPQDEIWEAMKHQHAQTPYQLTSIHTDQVTWSFLEFAQGLEKLTELFILERDSRTKLLTMTEKSTVNIELICQTVLIKHIDHLKRLVIRNDESGLWDLGPFAVLLVTSAPKLVELGIGIDKISHSFLIRFMHRMESLKALQLFLNCGPSVSLCINRVLADVVNHLLCSQEIKIDFLGVAYIHQGPVRNTIVDIAARRNWLDTMRATNWAGSQLDNEHGGESPLEYSGVLELGDSQIAGVKMWESRVWHWKL